MYYSITVDLVVLYGALSGVAVGGIIDWLLLRRRARQAHADAMSALL
jgi:hypothetical protein